MLNSGRIELTIKYALCKMFKMSCIKFVKNMAL